MRGTPTGVPIKKARARSTGTVVEVWHADDLGLDGDVEGGWWVTICEHGSSCHHETRELAISWSAAPEIWCEQGCREDVAAKADKQKDR